MAILTKSLGYLGRSPLNERYNIYTGNLNDFRASYSVKPGRYFVGFSLDASNNNLCVMTVAGVEITRTYTAGSGSFRKTNGAGAVTVGSGGILAWSGAGSTTGANGNFRIFWVRIDD